jgi:CheY-like chemotaxis protein
MGLKLKYLDRYRLWNDLVRASTDRLFVPTDDDVPLLHSVEALEVETPGLVVPLVLRATVVGRRGGSKRFASGVYVRVPQKEVDKCRRFLSLGKLSGDVQGQRRAPRVPTEVPVQFVQPELSGAFSTRNLSTVGMLCTSPKGLVSGQRIRVALRTSVPFQLVAEVAWVSEDRALCGLSFVDVDADTAARLRLVVEEKAAELLRPGATREVPVVVADDEPDILRFVSTALATHGYKVFQAHNGEEALKLIQHLHPALVLLDILMPGLDCADVCKFMRSDAELADIPVIFTSALEPATLHDVADESGATDYLSKPLHMSDLLNMMGTYLQR